MYENLVICVTPDSWQLFDFDESPLSDREAGQRSLREDVAPDDELQLAPGAAARQSSRMSA